MKFQVQKAPIIKRIAAFMLDLILLAVVATGVMWVVSFVTGYDKQEARYEEYLKKYAVEYGIVDEEGNADLDAIDISSEEYDKLPEEKKLVYTEMRTALSNDEEVKRTYAILSNLLILIPSLGIFFAYLIIEFVIPLIFKNGQTVGKKAFSLGVMRVDGIKATPFMLFARTLLGKFTVETMLPLMLLLLNGVFGTAGLIVVGLIALLELALLIFTKNRMAIHDAFAQTVVVDLPTQMIFDTPEALTEYKARIAAEEAERAEYFNNK